MRTDRWLIDGMNLIGSRPTGWWRDRERAMRNLVADLEAYARASGEEVTVVFDARPFALPSDGGTVRVRFVSARGRNAADDEIVRIVQGDSAASDLRIVTSDAELADRVRSEGAQVESTRPFGRRLERAVGKGER